MKKKIELKDKTGITLITLVVTIIVLLILAGVSIYTLFGGEGIITKSQKAAFLAEMTQIEESVQIKKTNIETQQILNDENIDLFEETLEQRNDLKVPNTFKEQVMYIRDGKPSDKLPSDYNISNFDVEGIYIIDKETGNGKEDTYAYDEKTEKVFKIPQTNIAGKIYHCTDFIESTNSSNNKDFQIKDEASIVTVDDERYYEPDLNGFDAENTYIIYYSSDFSKQISQTAEEYIKNGKQNILTQDGEEYQFHSYAKQKWANIKTSVNGVENWWVWIPRYAYKINGTSNTEEPISIIYIDLDNKPLNPKYNGVLPEDYEIHPAFTPSGEDGSKNLKGIWFSKYEPSYTEQGTSEQVLEPDMTGFDRDNTYIELYDSTTDTFSGEIKLSDANLSSVNNENKWYNYSAQQYANIKTLVNGVENWWVWIPRYAYKKVTEGDSVKEMEIIFVDINNKPLNTLIYGDSLPEGYEVHPAFTPSGEDGSKNLKGIWFSKYEPSQK